MVHCSIAWRLQAGNAQWRGALVVLLHHGYRGRLSLAYESRPQGAWGQCCRGAAKRCTCPV